MIYRAYKVTFEKDGVITFDYSCNTLTGGQGKDLAKNRVFSTMENRNHDIKLVEVVEVPMNVYDTVRRSKGYAV